MVKGKIWGTVCGEYREIEIDECDVIVAIGLKDKGDRIGSQLISFGGGLTTEDLVSSIADGAVRAVQEIGESPEEKKVLVRLFLRKIDEYTKESSPSFEEMMEKLERFLNESGIHEL